MANSFTRHIPNTITCFSLFSGCVACVMAFEAKYELAFAFIIIGAVFDFLDGFFARLLKAYSPMGKELDSLSDDITFGLAPALMVYSYLKGALRPDLFTETTREFIPYIAFLLAIFSALRLAKFNIDERQTSSFIGLPTPANALFWSSLIVGITESYVTITQAREIYPFLIIGLIFLFSYLLVSEIPMFSLKFKNFSWRDNKIVYLFLIVSVLLIVLSGVTGFAAVIGWYIILSLFQRKRR